MFDLIKKILGNETEQDNKGGGKAVDAHIALCVLLLEAAHVDGECSDEEMEHVVSTLTRECGVPRQEIDALITAGHRERNDSIDLFRFTRYINANFTHEEKIAVMEAVWRIIHTDAYLEAHEDHFAHKLANLLRLTHTELIDAKLKARQQLT
ncbi:MAG: TerB family tellurite resistance protein [Desulforhopalus sp.]